VETTHGLILVAAVDAYQVGSGSLCDGNGLRRGTVHQRTVRGQTWAMSEEALRSSDVVASDDVSFDPWPSTARVPVEWGRLERCSLQGVVTSW
jgi:hypothetical protein